MLFLYDVDLGKLEQRIIARLRVADNALSKLVRKAIEAVLAVQILRDRVKIRGLAVDGDLAAFTLPEQPHAALNGLFAI